VDSTQRRMIAVAVSVCAFAVGMAGLLNYFKYRATASRIIEQRLVFTGKSIENSIQSSLSLGLQFGDLTTLPAMLERERATDDLIMGIDVFDTEGRPLYSTDRLRGTRPAPASWVAAARKAVDKDWMVHAEEESAVGVALQNNFGLTIGHLALRYSQERVRQAAQVVAKDLALNSLGIFVVAATLASLALMAVMRRLGRDMEMVELALSSSDPARADAASQRGPFRAALQRFSQTVRSAEVELADARAQLQRGAGS
jgi:hypothetical protein